MTECALQWMCVCQKVVSFAAKLRDKKGNVRIMHIFARHLFYRGKMFMEWSFDVIQMEIICLNILSTQTTRRHISNGINLKGPFP